MYRIFIVEDDKTIAQTLMSHLKKWDYEVQCAEDFKNIRGEFEDFGADLILLDIGLPFFDGFYWCTEIRKVSTVPILFISSADDKMNIVMAMSIGGDEFIEKPFDLNVLTAKVQAILRRTYSFAGMSNIIEYKGISLDQDIPFLQGVQLLHQLLQSGFINIRSAAIDFRPVNRFQF